MRSQCVVEELLTNPMAIRAPEVFILCLQQLPGICTLAAVNIVDTRVTLRVDIGFHLGSCYAHSFTNSLNSTLGEDAWNFPFAKEAVARVTLVRLQISDGPQSTSPDDGSLRGWAGLNTELLYQQRKPPTRLNGSSLVVRCFGMHYFWYE